MNNIRHRKNYIIKDVIRAGLFVLIIILFFSCNAPQNNPLDPENPDNNLGTIQGVVQTFSLPFTGIPDVSIYWPKANKLVKSDANGKFVINNVPTENGSLIIQKDGYRPDTVINQFNPDQTFELNIQAKVSDRDNDIDSIKVFNNQLNLDKKLDFNITQNFFQSALSTSDLNVNDLEEVIGLDFNINVYDRFQNVYNIGSGKVSRVIKTPVLIESPSNADSVNSNPTLTWLRFKPGYPFTYTVEVYTNDFANSQIVARQQDISSDSTSYFVRTVLQPRDYYWVLWVVDQFQNRARSKPATFIVK